jgi:hypothetical protein
MKEHQMSLLKVPVLALLGIVLVTMSEAPTTSRGGDT